MNSQWGWLNLMHTSMHCNGAMQSLGMTESSMQTSQTDSNLVLFLKPICSFFSLCFLLFGEKGIVSGNLVC